MSKIGMCKVIVEVFLLEYTLEIRVSGLSFLDFRDFDLLEVSIGLMDWMD